MWRVRHVSMLVLFAILAGSAYMLTCTPASAWVFGLGNGDERYARTWRDRLSRFDDPNAAVAAFPEIEVIHFKNGEWVFGVTSDSHHSYWGGTIVIKDSNGQIRTYFGHVCGRYRLQIIQREAGSLADFDSSTEWETFGLRRQ